MRPNDVVATRSLSVLWICPECRGEYSYPVNERSLGDDACPYCRNTKVLPGFNSFETKYPKMMDEWDTINNFLIGVDSDRISPSDATPVWWYCRNCGYHYKMSVSKRINFSKRHMIACSKCKGRRQRRRYNG